MAMETVARSQSTSDGREWDGKRSSRLHTGFVGTVSWERREECVCHDTTHGEVEGMVRRWVSQVVQEGEGERCG